MELYQVSKKLHKLTEISITINTDGIHSENALVGYIAEDPFVVLCAWIDKYIISFYNQKIYPVGYCSFKYTIKIKDIGSIYEPSNISKSYYRDIVLHLQLVRLDPLSCKIQYLSRSLYRHLHSKLLLQVPAMHQNHISIQ